MGVEAPLLPMSAVEAPPPLESTSAEDASEPRVLCVFVVLLALFGAFCVYLTAGLFYTVFIPLMSGVCPAAAAASGAEAVQLECAARNMSLGFKRACLAPVSRAAASRGDLMLPVVRATLGSDDDGIPSACCAPYVAAQTPRTLADDGLLSRRALLYVNYARLATAIPLLRARALSAHVLASSSALGVARLEMAHFSANTTAEQLSGALEYVMGDAWLVSPSDGDDDDGESVVVRLQ